MNIKDSTDLLVKFLLPLITLIGGWIASGVNRKRNLHKDRQQLINDFQKSQDELYARLHEMQKIDLESASKNNLLLKKISQLEATNMELNANNEHLQKEVLLLENSINKEKNG